MDESHIVNEFHRIVDKHLQQTQSVLTRNLIKKIMQDEIIIGNNVTKAISRIRTTVKLFVDEKKAEDIALEMKRVVGL